ncbi:MAG: 8-oxoguanine deaminase [bacterium]
MILLKDIGVLFTGEEEFHSKDLLIDGGKIATIGDNIDLSNLDKSKIEIIDCSSLVVMPGLINTHHHFFQTLQRCIPEVQDSKLFQWLTNLYEIWRNIDEEAVYWSTLVACGELVKTGCTTTTDNLYVFPRGKSTNFIDIEIEAAKKVGIRFYPTRGSMSLGRSKGGLPPDEIVQDEDEILEDSERLIEKYHGDQPGSMVRIALGPCSPFSVSRDLLVATMEMARRKKVLLHTHLAETEDETDYCLERYGIRPLELMEECGWLGSDVWFAHGIHFNDDEISKLERTDTGICHCPTSNMRLGSGYARVPEMIRRGMRVGLGVDGSASNDTSDMLGEVRNCFLLHRLVGGSGAISARQALRLATIGGARLLKRDDIGKIEAGRCADIIGIRIDDISRAGAIHDLVGSVVMCGSSHNVYLAIINGEIVVKENHLVTIDEDEVVARANAIALRLKSA